MTKIAKVGGEWLAWTAAALGVWLLTLSSVTGADLIVAGPSAASCAAAAVAVRRTLGVRLDPSRRYLRWAVAVPAAVVADTVAVLALPWRERFRPRSEGHWQRIPVAPGPDPRPSTTRAAATLLVSLSPGSFVVNGDVDTGELLTHVLAGGRRSMTDAVRR
ncbi:MAG TPA: hypothetical protein VME70_10505 [Mycobacteriales bacterium]|nr:hypothetical protein [Mycobacteriales bacterium]